MLTPFGKAFVSVIAILILAILVTLVVQGTGSKDCEALYNQYTSASSTTTKPHVVNRYPIRHPLADIMSVVTGMHSYSGENTSEIAFFNKGNWVVTPIEPFSDYHDGSPMDADTAVYPYVPNALINAFIAENAI